MDMLSFMMGRASGGNSGGGDNPLANSAIIIPYTFDSQGEFTNLVPDIRLDGSGDAAVGPLASGTKVWVSGPNLTGPGLLEIIDLAIPDIVYSTTLSNAESAAAFTVDGAPTTSDVPVIYSGMIAVAMLSETE